VREVSDARVYAGIHWRFDVAAGEALGSEVGNYVVSHCLLPRDEDDGDDQLRAAAAAPAPVNGSLRADQVQPLLVEDLAHWQAAGVDTAAPRGADLRIADLGVLTLGQAADGVIWLVNNPAGWGWYVEGTPGAGRELAAPGDRGEQGRMDLRLVLEQEVGHLLGRGHEADGVMPDNWRAGARRTVSPVPAADTDGLGVALTGFEWSEETPWIGHRQLGHGSSRG
jgi:hypothetical protein